MTFDNVKEISCLKNSEILLRKIENIETTLKNMDCKFSYVTYFYLENNKMRFHMEIQMPVDPVD